MRMIGLALLACLTACGGKGTSGNTAVANTQAGSNQTSGADFKSTFREKFIAQCIGSAQAASRVKADFTPICGCSADKLLATKSPAELAQGPSADEAKAVAAQCAKEHPISAPS